MTAHCHRRTALAAILAFLTLAAPAAADDPVAPISIPSPGRSRPLTPAELSKRQNERRQQHEQTYRDSRELPGVFTMRDVCRLRVERNQWSVSSLAASRARNEQVRIKIQGHTGHAVLQTSGRRFFGGKISEFNLTLATFNDPVFVQVTTTISVQYGSLAITRTSETLNGFHTISLHQGHLLHDEFEASGPRSGVALTISHHSEQGDPTNLQFYASDISELRRRHPQEIERHLRPLLRQVGIESILAADAITARQVFSQELTPDPQIAATLSTLLPNLDLPDARQRDAALATLREQGPPLALAVAHLDRRGLSDQQNTLLDALVAPYAPQSPADIRRLRRDVEFLIDCLYSDDADIRAAAHQRLQATLDRSIPFELDAPPDRRNELVEALRPAVHPATEPTTRPAP